MPLLSKAYLIRYNIFKKQIYLIYVVCFKFLSALPSYLGGNPSYLGMEEVM